MARTTKSITNYNFGFNLIRPFANSSIRLWLWLRTFYISDSDASPFVRVTNMRQHQYQQWPRDDPIAKALHDLVAMAW